MSIGLETRRLSLEKGRAAEVLTGIVFEPCESWEQMHCVVLEQEVDGAGMAVDGVFYKARLEDRWKARVAYEKAYERNLPALFIERGREGLVCLRVGGLAPAQRLEWRLSLTEAEGLECAPSVGTGQPVLGRELAFVAVASDDYLPPELGECLGILQGRGSLVSNVLAELLGEVGYRLPGAALQAAVDWLEHSPLPRTSPLGAGSPHYLRPEQQLGMVTRQVGPATEALLVGLLELLEQCCERARLLRGAARLKYEGEGLLRKLAGQRLSLSEFHSWLGRLDAFSQSTSRSIPSAVETVGS
ncbi:MAG: hypothetical protein KC910_00840 [Candidatus Eremiobacteraeota bacterium]|nr:hypothetical protein [Candidatus Eremiobacteraeota bacterium]